jgi:hypothetical protein
MLGNLRAGIAVDRNTDPQTETRRAHVYYMHYTTMAGT